MENRIKEALVLRGMTEKDLCEKSHITKDSMDHWLGQHWQPKDKYLFTMAKVLNVSKKWLSGCDVPMERTAEDVRDEELFSLIKILENDETLFGMCVDLVKLESNQVSSVKHLVDKFVRLNSKKL